MKGLTSEITKLLDKLYNLRSEDSVILHKMEDEKTIATETKERTSKEKSELQDKITKLSDEESILGEQGKKLVEALSTINDSEFKVVLDKLNINFDPKKLSDDINGMLPDTINKVQDEIKSAKESLVKVENEMNSAAATIEELAIRKDEALANQARLNEYFDLALNGNINITRDSITSLLEKFDFNEDEQREAAKILMFPEDALYEYENNLKENEHSGKSISDVLAEAKETIETIDIEEEKEEDNSDNNDTSNEGAIELLKELDIDTFDLTTSDIEKINANYDADLIRRNVNYIKNNNIKTDIFIDNVEFLYDKELIDKVNRLLEIGKEPFDIYLNPNILNKYNKEELNKVINDLIESGLDPKRVPLIAY